MWRRRLALLKAAVDVGEGAGDLTLHLLYGKPSPPGKLGVARAVEPYGEEDRPAPLRHPLKRHLHPFKNLAFGEVLLHHAASGVKASR